MTVLPFLHLPLPFVSEHVNLLSKRFAATQGGPCSLPQEHLPLSEYPPVHSVLRPKEGQQDATTFVTVLGGHCSLKMSLSTHDFPFFFEVYSDGQHINRQERRWRNVMDDAFAHSGQERFFIRDEVCEREIAAWFLQPKKKVRRVARSIADFLHKRDVAVAEQDMGGSKRWNLYTAIIQPLDLLKAIVKKCSVCNTRSWNMVSMRVFPEPSTPMKR
ncbi:hypothetical protein [Ktedonobacter sp. SOSP1-85]|uniref:hypothetical protein n=1 Tax=Ktedonobacter sp. SOSP1-85 TaxID=2778367 RepID=UPI001914FE9C|nr:hypothetical protein [Ktedonobacter sp. SOSP1-85]